MTQGSTAVTPAPSEPSQENEVHHEISSSKAISANAPATIQIYARVRPARANSKFPVDPDRYWYNAAEQDKPRIGFRIPKDQAAGMVNNQREAYDFRFDRIFDMTSGQEEVFDVVAKPVVLSVMDGYNGTIFAYGQTGSGKTFTITGGAERYADRGIIPRTLQFVFKEMQKRNNYHFEISVSYLEIYNEVAYDLLDSSREAKKLEDLPKVSLQEDDGGNIHLRNLSCVTAKDEEEALNLLFIGDTNRMIAETPSNPASSRSHCLFIVTIMGRREGEDTIRRSKLHLVDLAGSERVGRTGINGTLLKEAKYINLSLHYLEQVIIALHEKATGKRTHVPYRNSMMTSVLRDSLGGNCRTTMIATVAVEDPLIDESISTCRFAQRVALISNNAQLNEELDPRLLIARLKRENARLKTELAIARGEAGDHTGEELPDYEKERVKDAVNDYLGDSSADASLLFADGRKIQEAFRILKNMIGSGQTNGHDSAASTSRIITAEATGAPSSSSTVTVSDSAEIERLQRLIAHRDNEINILVEMVNKLRNGEEVDKKSMPLRSVSVPTNINAPDPRCNALSHGDSKAAGGSLGSMGSTARLAASVPQLTSEKAKAFEIFKQGYPSGAWIEGQKTFLKGKYGEAKALGEKANQLRTEIKSMKSTLAQSDAGDAELEAANVELRTKVAEYTARYKEAYQQLKELRLEIEHLQHLLEQARHRLTRDFEHWYINVYLATKEAEEQQQRETSTDDQTDARSTASTTSSTFNKPSEFDTSISFNATSRYDSAMELSDTSYVQSPRASTLRMPIQHPRSRTGSVDHLATEPHVSPAREVPILPKYVYPPNIHSGKDQSFHDPSAKNPGNPSSRPFSPRGASYDNLSSLSSQSYRQAPPGRSPSHEKVDRGMDLSAAIPPRTNAGDPEGFGRASPSRSYNPTYLQSRASFDDGARPGSAGLMSRPPGFGTQMGTPLRSHSRSSYHISDRPPSQSSLRTGGEPKHDKNVQDDVKEFYRIREDLMNRMGRGM
ncbi:hypothetical protein PhCBS80983_g03680 [Powellomyces hirtus]|uniref:Kinesin motor domain-containing protein n=1 Tax=Powellomyces hirtus TaxID=109895 RepID=A0A507E1I2_9FUNG|nr:hypothetical protein PhCBS80983_g03680 [Powellomyces hirtus]